MAERHGARRSRSARATARTYRLRLVWHHARRPTTGTTTSLRTRCSGSSSTTSGGSPTAPDSGPRAPPRVARRLRAGEPRTSPRRSLDELDREPDAAVFFHDYHLYVAPGLVRAQRARGDARALRPHPVAAARLLARAAGGRSGARSRRAARERRRRFPHRRAGAGTSCVAARTSSAPTSSSRRAVSTTPTGPSSPTARPISVDPIEFEELAQATSACWQRRQRSLEERPELLDPARRSHRPVEERRPRVPRLRAVPRARTPSCTAACGCWRCSTRRGRTFPSTRSTWQRSSARPGRQRPLPARRLDAARPADRRQLPAGRRRVQAVRRAARERDLRRHEPRREGGAAREHARRRARPLRERRRPRGARRLGVTVNPFDVARQAQAIYRALTMPPEERRAPARRRSARRSASTTSPAGSMTSSPTSTRAASEPAAEPDRREP